MTAANMLKKYLTGKKFFFVKSNLKHLFTFLGSKDRALFAKSAPELWDLGMGENVLSEIGGLFHFFVA